MKKEEKEQTITINKINFRCISCNQNYSTQMAISKGESLEKTINSCSQCNPIYTGASASTIKTGSVEKFHERAAKTKAKIKKTK